MFWGDNANPIIIIDCVSIHDQSDRSVVTGPAVRAEMDTPLKRAVIVQGQILILLLSDMDLCEPTPMTITALDLSLRLI